MTNATGKVVSEIQTVAGQGEVMRQRIRLDGMPARVVQVRKPHWADSVKAVDPGGKDLPLAGEDEFLATKQAVTEAVFVYRGDVYAENRRCVRLISSLSRVSLVCLATVPRYWRPSAKRPPCQPGR